jgi:hypothetical protein
MKPLLSATFTAPSGLPGPSSFGTLIVNVTNILLFVAGTVSVIFIIVGGIMYATSAGNEQNTQKAKSTITNAVIGLVIAILAFTIVNFVIGVFK